VLHESSEADRRALAAQLLGYVTDKQSVVDDLVQAMRDPDENVRNNAMRALMVFTRMTTAPAPRVPYEPFVEMLNSPVWTDRNKSSNGLQQLSRGRDAALLSALREQVLGSLVEMAAWKTKVMRWRPS
jgi:HEAT repeat protein